MEPQPSTTSPMAIYQIFIKLLDGTTRCLQTPSPTISTLTLKHHLLALTHIPLASQRLLTGTLTLSDQTLIHASPTSLTFPSLTLLLRLPGGKGGFGSLLRGAATKAGQKKTNNFDACRDMSGRRLRHVNAEKKLVEWKAEAEDRKLEKLAEQFLKKKAKEVKKNSSVDVENYLEKYRTDAAKCTEEVEESVRESFELYKGNKRKMLAGSEPAKRLKIWLGKNKVEESESEDDNEDSDDDGVNKKSVVLDDGNCSNLNGVEEETLVPRSGSGIQPYGESSGRGSEKSNLEDVNGLCDIGAPLLMGEGSGDGEGDGESSGRGSEKSNLEDVNGLCHIGPLLMGEGSGDGEGDAESVDTVEAEMGGSVDTVAQAIMGPIVNVVHDLDESNLGKESYFESELVVLPSFEEVQNSDQLILAKEKPVELQSSKEPVTKSNHVSDAEEVLNFDIYNCGAELEVLGMERLKTELQERGLKCGGTLRERASRLFLLKTTPLDKLPKKLLAKLADGGK